MSEQSTEKTEDAPEATEEQQDTTKKADAPEAEAETPDKGEQQEGSDADDAWDPKRAKEKIRKLNQEIRSTKDKLSKADEDRSATVGEKDKQITDMGSENLRLRVGYELGLPIELADRLKGGTREDLVADAEKLMEQISPTKRPSTRKPSEALRGGLEPEKEPEETDVRKLGERMFSR